MSDRKTVGIDLGTTYSVVAFLDSSLAPHTAMNLEGDLTTPSAVFFEDDVAIVGKEAIKAATHEPEAVALHVKRDMGKPRFHQEIRGQQLPPEVIQAAILRKLISDATLKIGDVDEAVITVPAFFNEPRRKATMDAGRLAGLKVLDIINEPTAAAIAYGVHAGFLSADGTAPTRETVLVYDLGGGTFDVTLMEIQQLQFTALATDGDVHLGGIDWDRRIVDHIADAFQQQHNLDPREDPEAARELAAEAEDAKRALTSRTSVTVRFSYSGKRSQITLTREQFETMTNDLLQRTIFTVERLLKSAKKSWPDLTRILLVGGSTRMPMIQAALHSASGMEVDRSLSPDEAVAHGAAIYAGFVKRGMKATDRNLAVKNVNSHDLGVLAREKATGMQRRRIMIPRNSLLPARSKSKFVTQKTGQKRVVINVIEGGDDSGKNSTSIGKCVVSSLPRDLPAGAPVIVQFVYKTSGRLSVSAELPTIGGKAEMTIERSSGMDERTLRHWAQRISAGRYLDFGNTDDPNGQSANATRADRTTAHGETRLDKTGLGETGLVQVPLAEFESPHVYTDDEDSEIFSDLDF